MKREHGMARRLRGVNVNPDHGAVNSPPPARLLEHGINAVRLVSQDSNDVRAYVTTCQEAGVFVLAVLANESHGYILDEANAVQVGNEPDGLGISSWKMTEEEYINLWNSVRQANPDRELITAGLLRSNQAWRWEHVAA
jgi:hypothetical protein